MKGEFLKVQKILERVEENKVENISGAEKFRQLPNITKPSIKLSTYDEKSSRKLYKMQFSIVTEANGCNYTKAQQLAASLRAEAADILRALPND